MNEILQYALHLFFIFAVATAENGPFKVARSFHEEHLAGTLCLDCPDLRVVRVDSGGTKDRYQFRHTLHLTNTPSF